MQVVSEQFIAILEVFLCVEDVFVPEIVYSLRRRTDPKRWIVNLPLKELAIVSFDAVNVVGDPPQQSLFSGQPVFRFLKIN